MHIDGRVIFVHNPRASGTSIRRALLHGADPNANIPFPGSEPSRTTRNTKHLFAASIRQAIGEETWQARESFAIVRNPWDRMVSLWGLFNRHREKYCSGQEIKLNKIVMSLNRRDLDLRQMGKEKKRRLRNLCFDQTFKSWLLTFADEYAWSPIPYLDEKRPLTRIQQVEWFDGVGRILRFEDRDSINVFLTKRGYPIPGIENTTQRRAWQDYYDSETYDWVANVFVDDIQRFNY